MGFELLSPGETAMSVVVKYSLEVDVDGDVLRAFNNGLNVLEICYHLFSVG